MRDVGSGGYVRPNGGVYAWGSIRGVWLPQWWGVMLHFVAILAGGMCPPTGGGASVLTPLGDDSSGGWILWVNIPYTYTLSVGQARPTSNRRLGTPHRW